MTLTVTTILMVFTSRTYLKQTRNRLDRSGNMFCVLHLSSYTPPIASTLPPPFSLATFHTLSLSIVQTLTLTFTHSISLNLTSSVRQTISRQLTQSLQIQPRTNHTVCMEQIRHKHQNHVLFCNRFTCSHPLAQSIHSQPRSISITQCCKLYFHNNQYTIYEYTGTMNCTI